MQIKGTNMAKKNLPPIYTYANPGDMPMQEFRDRMIGDIPADEFMTLTSLAMPDIGRMMNGEEIEFDYYGCDHYFLIDFINDDMRYDFPLIAKDFLQHEYDNLKDYDKADYIDYFPDYCDPVKMIENRILNLMYGAVKSKNAYAISLFQTLYKTYYKSEYKQLKRFSHLSLSEVLALSNDKNDNGDSPLNPPAAARILAMADIFGIEIGQDNFILYRLLNQRWDDFSEYLEDMRDARLDIDGEVYKRCAEELDAGQENKDWKEIKKSFETSDQALNFVESAMRYMGYPADYAFILDESTSGTKEDLLRTSAILKTCDPETEYSFDDLQVYAVILKLVRGICVQLNHQDVYLDLMLGIHEEMFEDDEEHWFKPEQVSNQAGHRVKVEKSAPVKEAVRVINDSEEATAKLLAEIEELRNKMSRQENELKRVRSQYADTRDELNVLKVKAQELENDREELIALREHVYKYTEEMDASDDSGVKIDEMRQAIEDKNIVIIGGNENWVKKLRQEFPNWKYVKANVSPTVASSPVIRADHVYIFTDTLGHSNYYKYIQVIREHNVPFSYMHGVNIEGNIRQVYADMVEDK